MVKITDVNVGDELIADEGFICLEDGEVCIVKADEVGDTYVSCSSGRHYLSGQEDDYGFYVGLKKESECST